MTSFHGYLLSELTRSFSYERDILPPPPRRRRRGIFFSDLFRRQGCPFFQIKRVNPSLPSPPFFYFQRDETNPFPGFFCEFSVTFFDGLSPITVVPPNLFFSLSEPKNELFFPQQVCGDDVLFFFPYLAEKGKRLFRSTLFSL